MQFIQYLTKRRALPHGGLWCELVIVVIVICGMALHPEPSDSILWPVVYALLPFIWMTGIHRLREDLRRCRRGCGIYNWRMTISRILAIANGFAVVWGIAIVIRSLT